MVVKMIAIVLHKGILERLGGHLQMNKLTEERAV